MPDVDHALVMALRELIRSIVREELEAIIPTVTSQLVKVRGTMSEAEFCRRVGISTRTARRLRMERRLKFVAPVPGRVRYTEDQLEEFLRQRESGGKSRM